MIIDKIVIEHFKRIGQVELPLADLNILVGTNSSGKSSIIQAVHLAACLIRQADRIAPDKTSTVGIDVLDYLPSERYSMLGHQSEWGNKEGSPSSKVKLGFSSDDGTFVANCEIRSARNAGISIKGQVPSELAALLRTKQNFFSAYIPGISGIPNREEKRSHKVVLKSCSYGDSNVILRNVLLILREKEKLSILENWLSRVVGDIKLHVTHDEQKDLTIDCQVEINNLKRPIELTGTGYLQLIQLFSYILLFEPGILLVDEPDIHLHPSVQERLVQALEEVAREQKVRILLTTHSPFIVRAASPAAEVFWIKDGAREETDRQQVELALGWGAFGKKIVVVSEDNETRLLRKLIAQWPELDRVITFYPGTGFKNLPTPTQAEEIFKALGGKYKILVHRDRDSLIDEEVENLKAVYSAHGVEFWTTKESDVEAYFCSPAFLYEITGEPLADCEHVVTDLLNKNSIVIQDQFTAQRAAHNSELHKAGGSPTNSAVWQEFQNRPLKGAKGKFIFGQLKNKFQAKFSMEKVAAHKIAAPLALDLREAVLQILDQS